MNIAVLLLGIVTQGPEFQAIAVVEVNYCYNRDTGKRRSPWGIVGQKTGTSVFLTAGGVAMPDIERIQFVGLISNRPVVQLHGPEFNNALAKANCHTIRTRKWSREQRLLSGKIQIKPREM